MRNDQNPSLSADELRAYVDARDDFAFEREVFTHATRYGFKALHAGLYEDPATSKIRQFDVRAWKELRNCHIRLAIECKAIQPAFPLLVSCVPRPREEAYHNVMCGSQGWGLAAVRTIESAMYDVGQYVGKDICQIGRDKGNPVRTNDKDLFDKYQQALASSAELIQEAAEFHRPTRADERFSTVLPILAVPDGSLWIVRYASNGKLEGNPEPAKEVPFYLGRKYTVDRMGTTFTISHLHVMTRSAVADFLRHLDRAPKEDVWHKLFPEMLRQ
jgi:hypothetical protein